MTGYRLADGGPRTTREQQVLFESRLVAVGLFDARPEDPHFRCSGVPGEHLLVFPATSVRIERLGEEPFVADRNLVVFYNPDQQYTRSPVSPRGDRGHWFALAPAALAEIVAGRDRPRPGGALFQGRRAAADSPSYVAQLALVRRLASGETVEALEIEETALGLARRVLGRAPDGADPAPPPSAAHRELAERARAALARRYSRTEPLSDLAASLGTSPYHLSRVFRRITGSTLHAYREQLRLRRAWVELPDRAGDLTGLALDLGYSSHSHFTAAFRDAFGSPPSRTAGFRA